MLELRRAEPEEALEYCAASGIPLSKGWDIFLAWNQGEVVGYCVSHVEGKRLTVLAANGQDPGLCDGLVRAVFLDGLSRGANTADFGPKFDAALWSSLAEFGYTDKSSNDIDKFLTKCKKCAEPKKNRVNLLV